MRSLVGSLAGVLAEAILIPPRPTILPIHIGRYGFLEKSTETSNRKTITSK